MVDPELESCKTSIDLRAYAAHEGDSLDGKESWRGSAVMRHANGDKIIIKRDTDNHYVYFSVQDDADHGTIIDFVWHRKDLNLGATRKKLRTYSNSLRPLPAFVPSAGQSRIGCVLRQPMPGCRTPPHIPILKTSGPFRRRCCRATVSKAEFAL